MGRLTVVDVGHGSCTVVESGDEYCVVDAPQGRGVKNFLASRQIRHLKYVVESHGHRDHAGGLINLVTDESILVDRFLVNPEHKRSDEGRPTTFENRMAAALAIGRKLGTSIVTAVTADATGTFLLGDLRVSVLWPTGPIAYAGLGAHTDYGVLTSNSLSVVLRIEAPSGFSVLVPGDLDLVGLTGLLAEVPKLTANVLVAPHHGGLMGTPAQTAQAWRLIRDKLCPTEVLVSIRREQNSNPRDEIIDALSTRSGESARLRCTQLSERCGSPAGFGPVSSIWSEGRTKGVCCAGSIVVDLKTGSVLHTEEHDELVSSLSSPVCIPLLPSQR